jgi:hypothetical protein
VDAKQTQDKQRPAYPGLETQVNRDMEAPVFIVFPESTGCNISGRRAEFFASLPRIDVGVQSDYARRRASEDRQFFFALRFASACVGVLIGLLLVALR